MARTRTIYLLHFEPAYSAAIGDTGRVKTAGHYLGSTAGDVQDRLHRHLRGAGSPLVRAAVRAGCDVQLVAAWPGGRNEEREAKRARHHARLCPVCRGEPVAALELV